MTFKQKFWKVVEWFIGSLFTLAVGMLILYSTNVIEGKEKAEEEMDSKASKDYVDMQDSEIEDAFKEADKEIQRDAEIEKADHQIQHNETKILLQSMDRKIDILLTE